MDNNFKLHSTTIYLLGFPSSTAAEESCYPAVFLEPDPFLAAPPIPLGWVGRLRGAARGQPGRGHQEAGSFTLQASSLQPERLPQAQCQQPQRRLPGPGSSCTVPIQHRGKALEPALRSSIGALEGPGAPGGDFKRLTVLMNNLLTNFPTTTRWSPGMHTQKINCQHIIQYDLYRPEFLGI